MFVYRYDDAKPRPRYTFTEMLDCIEREIKRRKQKYPGYVDTGRMNILRADREIAMMIQISEHVRATARTEWLPL